MPNQENLDDYLDMIIPMVRPWGEDLREQEFYVGRPWLEIRDGEGFHEAVLHFFNPDGEYLVSVDGNVSRGKWRYVKSANKLILENSQGKAHTSELYNLAFMSSAFFILRKHGDQKRKGRKKYFVMGYEPYVAGLEWREYVELLYNQYTTRQTGYKTIIVILLIVAAAIIIFSMI